MTREPIFKSVFGHAWDNLPPVMKAHYANRPYSDDLVIVEGTLNVLCSGPFRLLGPLFALMGSIPPFNARNVPAIVHFRSDRHTGRYHFERLFHFPGRKPYVFRSYMLPLQDGDVMEVTRPCLGWRAFYGWEDGKVVMKHRGYALVAGRWHIPLPLHLVMGKGYAEEVPIDDDTFEMRMHLTHPLWGRIYEYTGHFRVSKRA